MLSRLHAAGLQTIVPTLRGFGTTCVVDGAPRTEDSAILAINVIALMDALGIERFTAVGPDWDRTRPRRWRSAGPIG